MTSTHHEPKHTFDAVVDGDGVARASRHTLVAQVTTMVSRMAVNIVLARLITPDDFGVVAAGIVIMMITWQMTDLGTSAVVIQRSVIDDALVCSLFYVNLVIGAVLCTATFVLADPIAGLFRQPDAAPAIQALSTICVIAACGNMHHGLLRRMLQFRELAVINIANAVTSGVVGIGIAVLGGGLWALVLGTIAGTSVSTVGAWHYQGWRPSAQLDLGRVRMVARSSIHFFYTSALAIAFNQLDKVIVSRLLGGGGLGVYSLAQRTVTAPVNTVSEAVSTVSFSVFARDQNDSRALRAGVTRVGGVVALVVLPATIGLAVLAPEAVTAVYGARWEAAIRVTQVLAPLAAVQAISNVPRSVMYAMGRSDWLYRWGLAYCVLGSAGMLMASRWGLVGVSVGLAAVVTVLSPIEMRMALALIDMRLVAFLRSLGLLVSISAATGLAAWCAAAALDRAGEGAGVRLLAGTASGVAVYAVLIAVWRPQALADARRVVGRWAT